jgi:hypothetical protein
MCLGYLLLGAVTALVVVYLFDVARNWVSRRPR